MDSGRRGSCDCSQRARRAALPGTFVVDDEVVAAMQQFYLLRRRITHPPHSHRRFREACPCSDYRVRLSAHATMPEHARLYGVPLFGGRGRRSTDFAGASHQYISERVTDLWDAGEIKVSCHLGGSCRCARSTTVDRWIRRWDSRRNRLGECASRRPGRLRGALHDGATRLEHAGAAATDARGSRDVRAAGACGLSAVVAAAAAESA